MAFAAVKNTAVGPPPASFVESQTLSQTAPTAKTDGILLGQISAVQVVVEANSGQTLSGAGSILISWWDDAIGAWVRLPSGDLTVGTSGARRLALPPLSVNIKRGALYAQTSGVTVSGGTTVNVYLLGWQGLPASMPTFST